MIPTVEERLERAAAELELVFPPAQPHLLSSMRRRWRRRKVATATCGRLVVAAFVTAVASVGDRPTTRFSRASVSSAPGTTPATSAPNRPSVSTPATTQWKSAIETALSDVGSQLKVDKLVPNDYPPFGVAAISNVGGGRVVFDLQTFADGEYRTDANWQMGVAGATKPGVTVPEGTLFEFDEPGSGVRAVAVVGPVGIVSVHAESVPLAALPSVDGFRTIARALARSASAVAKLAS